MYSSPTHGHNFYLTLAGIYNAAQIAVCVCAAVCFTDLLQVWGTLSTLSTGSAAGLVYGFEHFMNTLGDGFVSALG